MTRLELQSYDVPDTPGVYFFRGPKGEILYIGKATSLRDRVRSYFGAGLAEARSPAIVSMVEKAQSLTWQECGSVLEALIVEANLIKKHQPPFNVDEKDDKSWNYLVITKEAFPRVLVVRGRELNDPMRKADYVPRAIFGPYPHGGQLKEALKIVRKIFQYRDTCIPADQKSSSNRKAPLSGAKPCFNAQIGLCPGVCSGAMGADDYAHLIRNISDLFKGNFHGLKRRLGNEMQAAAKAERFEEATTLRRQISALEHIRDVSLIKDEARSGNGRGVRIEAYDVAHTGGSETVGVMTVVRAGEAQKEAYRKFIIRTATNDDTASLGEMLERRLAHSEWEYPRVIVVDGGTGQVNRARKVLKSAGVLIPIVGVVKDDRHKAERLIGDARSIEVYGTDILLANAEAHRYAITWHRKKLAARMAGF